MIELEEKIDSIKLAKIADILKVISHPVRLEVLEMLQQVDSMSVAEMRGYIFIEQSLLSHHLIKMKDKGVLTSYRKGKNIFYELAIPQITSIFDCMRHCNI